MSNGQEHSPTDSHLPAGYLEFFARFNRGEYFEAHEVLEAVWLPIRGQPLSDFYKALIQLAGAFVHLQKGRLQPAATLFRLADANFAKYPAQCEQLDVRAVRQLIHHWQVALEQVNLQSNPYYTKPRPQLFLTQS